MPMLQLHNVYQVGTICTAIATYNYLVYTVLLLKLFLHGFEEKIVYRVQLT